jgi:23S rRNA (cytosine1962-C5)-methyltransferase
VNGRRSEADREAVVQLRKPLNRQLRCGHPWIYGDALVPTRVAPGTTVTVLDDRGRFVARGLTDAGPIAVRVWTIRDEPLDAELLGTRIDDAIALRDRVIGPQTNAYRLLHGEGDRIPGVVCDVYDRFASLRLDGQGIERWSRIIVNTLVPKLQARGCIGLVLRTGRRAQRSATVAWGETPPSEVQVREHGMLLSGDLMAGQKTGLFLDHRESRRRVRMLAAGLRVLDLYSYVGGFSAAAGLGKAAHVTTVDASAGAIDHAGRTWLANGLDPMAQERVVADVAEFLGARLQAGDRWDLVIADPPSFAPSQAVRTKALRSYVRLHETALRVLVPGGIYLAASCSSHVDRGAFDETLAEGARKARRILQVLDRWGAPPDHPRLAAFPEGDYLAATLSRTLD